MELPLTAIGVDLALNHGAAVGCDGSSTPSLLCAWDRGALTHGPHGDKWSSMEAKGRKRTYPLLLKYSQGLFAQLLPFLQEGVIVGVDWDPTESFWGSRVSANQKTLILGYLSRGIVSYGAIPVVLNPSVVRNYYGLKGKVSKGEVWTAALTHHASSLDHEWWQAHTNEDVRDAYLLALICRDAEFLRRVGLWKT